MWRTRLVDQLSPLLWHYPFMRGRYRLSRWLVPDVSVIPAGRVITTKAGVRVRLGDDRMYTGLYLFGEYEPGNSTLFRRLVRPGDVVFDVGTNFGWFAALLGRTVGTTGQVHGFEPMPPFAALAAETLRFNAIDDVVRLNNLGLSDQPGESTIYTFAGLPHGHASTHDLGRNDATAHTCRMTTLDAYVAEQGIARIDFLKADVEGHELEVFRGGKTIFSRPDAPLCVFEINTDCLNAKGRKAQDLQDILLDYGYRHFWTITLQGRLIASPERLAHKDGDVLAAKPEALARVRQTRCVCW
jgi:FkbM family methyltransferase